MYYITGTSVCTLACSAAQLLHFDLHTFSSNASQLDSLVPNEVQRLVDVVDLVHPHLTPLLSRRYLLARDELQEAEESQTITQINAKLINLDAHLAQMRVAPSRESLHQEIK